MLTIQRFGPTAVLVAGLVPGLITPHPAHAQYLMEHLGRGVVAVRASATTVYVGWRLLGPDPAEIAFNVYRSTKRRRAGEAQREADLDHDGLRRYDGRPRRDQCLHRASRPRRT